MGIGKWSIVRGGLIGTVGAILVFNFASTSASVSKLHDESKRRAVVISSGDLSVNKIGEPVWKNSNQEVVTSAIPGETLTLSQGVDMAATGDNLRVEFSVSPMDSTGSVTTLPQGYSGSYEVLDKNGIPVAPAQQFGGSLEANPTGAIRDGEEDFFLKITVTYPDDLPSGSESPTFTATVKQKVQ